MDNLWIIYEYGWWYTYPSEKHEFVKPPTRWNAGDLSELANLKVSGLFFVSLVSLVEIEAQEIRCWECIFLVDGSNIRIFGFANSEKTPPNNQTISDIFSFSVPEISGFPIGKIHKSSTHQRVDSVLTNIRGMVEKLGWLLMWSLERYMSCWWYSHCIKKLMNAYACHLFQVYV